MMPDNSFCSLSYRSAIYIYGADASSFLQRMLANDLRKVTESHSIYALLLSPQGKYLYDFFIVEHENGFLLDCTHAQAAQIITYLDNFIIYGDIQTEIVEDWICYALQCEQLNLNSPGKTIPFEGGYIYHDPRHEDMGLRALMPKDSTLLLSRLKEIDVEDYHRHRMQLVVPCGTYDMISKDTYPHDFNMDNLNAINYEKGCYVGQEVTARMHYKGQAKKTLQHIILPEGTPTPKPGEAFTDANNQSGTYTYCVGNECLAIVAH